MAAMQQQLVTRLMQVMGLNHGGRGVPAELVSAQLKAARSTYPVTFISTILTAMLVVMLAPRLDLVDPCFGVLVLVSLYTLHVWRKDKRDNWVVRDPQAVILQQTGIAFVTAAAWNLLLSAALVESEPQGRILTCGIMAGVMAVGALNVATLPMASMAFLVGAMVVLGPIIIVTDLPLASYPVLMVFCTLLAKSVMSQARLFSDSYHASLDLVEATRQQEAAETARIEERARADIVEARAQQQAQERAIEERRVEMIALAERFEASLGEAVKALGEAARETRAHATTLAASSAAQADQSGSIAEAAARTRHTASSMHATADRLSGSAADVAQRVALQAEVTGKVADEAQAAETVIAELIADADRVGQVVAMIAAIAGQTNLLALNAAIEAARAGEMGVGFSTVANEVKTLAIQTKTATRTIEEMIIAMQRRVGVVAQTMGGILTQIGEVSNAAAAIRAATDEQTEVAATISRDARSAASDNEKLHVGVEGAARASDTCKRLAADMATSTASIAERAETLARGAQSFVVELRAA